MHPAPLAVLLFLAPLASSSAAAPSEECGPIRVFFDKNSSSVSSTAMQIVENAGLIIKDCQPTMVVVTGHIDGSETKSGPNLGAARAKVIANALRKLVHSAPIVTEDAGFSDPMVPTKDGVSEPHNRRVVIEPR